MRRRTVLIFFLLFNILRVVAQEKPLVAVLPFHASGVSKPDAYGVTLLFETALLNTKAYTVIEQTQMESILQTQEISLSDCTDIACAVRIGQLLSAQQIVVGTVGKIASLYYLNAKIVDVTTSKIISAEGVQAKTLEALTDVITSFAYQVAGLEYSGKEKTLQPIIMQPKEKQPPTITVEKAYGSLVVEVKTPGILYIDGARQTRIPAGGTARISDLEISSYTLEIHYDDGERESKGVTVLKDRTVVVAFGYMKAPEGFVLVEAGTFRIGSTNGDYDEKPVHEVTLSRSFYMSQYEVTQKQWREVMDTNPSHFKGDGLPVERASWYDAVEYCNRLSRREGLTPCYSGSGNNIVCDFSAAGYRLPTEAEWEYAARGGNKSRGYTYSGSNSAVDVG